tara:strand:+ start:2451 stop:3869 length:1419 start_codon:yes stop_codon:yes gene_type:complete
MTSFSFDTNGFGGIKKAKERIQLLQQQQQKFDMKYSNPTPIEMTLASNKSNLYDVKFRKKFRLYLDLLVCLNDIKENEKDLTDEAKATCLSCDPLCPGVDENPGSCKIGGYCCSACNCTKDGDGDFPVLNVEKFQCPITLYKLCKFDNSHCQKVEHKKACNFIFTTMLVGCFLLFVSYIVFALSSNGTDTQFSNITAWMGSWMSKSDTSEYCDGHTGSDGFKAFKNYYGGMVLGLCFGFLDNWGLFYGMDTLAGMFRSTGWWIVSGIILSGQEQKIKDIKDVDEKKKLLTKINKIASDFDAGLGNTFSDLLGVMLGTAAMQIAKSGLGIDPQFWAGDLVSFFIGCLLGVLLPGIQANSVELEIPVWKSAAPQLCIFVAVFMLAIPSCANGGQPAVVYISASLVGIAIISALVLTLFQPLWAHSNYENLPGRKKLMPELLESLLREVNINDNDGSAGKDAPKPDAIHGREESR